MDHFRQIYSSRAADYHRMIAPEDVEGNLRQAIESVVSVRGKRVLDLGAGTGRLELLLAGEAAQVIGLDLHWEMLYENARQRSLAAIPWSLIQGDARALPFPSACVEVVTAGWAIGHLRGWYADDWQRQIGAVLSEMRRVCVPGGNLLILETLTTGSLTPAPPTAALAEYYAWLENEWGFQRQAIRTDYQFASVEEAVERTEFFFGAELANTIRANGWARVPEWTGVWSKEKAEGRGRRQGEPAYCCAPSAFDRLPAEPFRSAMNGSQAPTSSPPLRRT
jgi:ubiquinone/menaquinone biosynthesis C-methylase UbiE